MDSLMALREHLNARIADALASTPVGEKAGIYVVSLLVYDAEDDPRRPTITVGYNTEERAAACTPGPGQKAKWPIASDAAEARWNYAFWLQNALDVICDDGRDPAGAKRVRAWAQDKGYWYSNEEEDQDIEAALRRVHELEYYEEIAAQNEAANPPGLVVDFIRWVRGQ
jgi:hypothetical protein